jgi:HSP20 family protein
MQQMMRWEPFRDADEFFRSFLQPAWGRGPSAGNEGDGRPLGWLPAVDIHETDSEYRVTAEVPGIRREDVKVRLEDNVLTIEGERKEEKEAKGERSHRIERSYGAFCRRFTLPEDADASKVSADCKDGVVRVHIPKRPEQKPKAREIAIQ